MVPLHVVVDGADVLDGVGTASAQVAAALQTGRKVSTSAPSPASFLDAYVRAAAGGATQIVSVHMSAGLSSTMGAAVLAAKDAPVPVTVIDSRALGMAMGYPVLAGAVLAAAGADAVAVADLVRRQCSTSQVFFYVDTLEYLRRGGRIGRAGAFLGSALAIKPILALQDGQIVPVEKVRTASKAIGRLEELAVAAAGGAGARVAVQHVGSAERAHALADRLRLHVEGAVDVVELGAVVGAHVGPGTLAVAVVLAV